jgi:integrase
LTKKEAREFHESGEAKKTGSRSGGVVTVADGIEKWLGVCEKEGRDGRDPVTDFTLKGYKYRAHIISSFAWEKSLQELSVPDIVEFRSWLLGNYPRSMAHFVLSSFHSMILEMVFRGVLAHDVAARVSIRERSRYEEPVTIPSEKEVMDLLAAADTLARLIQRTAKPSVHGSVTVRCSILLPIPACGHRNISPWLMRQ